MKTLSRLLALLSLIALCPLADSAVTTQPATQPDPFMPWVLPFPSDANIAAAANATAAAAAATSAATTATIAATAAASAKDAETAAALHAKAAADMTNPAGAAVESKSANDASVSAASSATDAQKMAADAQANAQVANTNADDAVMWAATARSAATAALVNYMMAPSSYTKSYADAAAEDSAATSASAANAQESSNAATASATAAAASATAANESAEAANGSANQAATEVAAWMPNHVRPVQRLNSKLVDIDFDVTKTSGQLTVGLQISADGGSTWEVPAKSLTGAIGSVTLGSSLRITWDAGADWNQQVSSQIQFRLTVAELSGLVADSANVTVNTRGAVNIDAASWIKRTDATEVPWGFRNCDGRFLTRGHYSDDGINWTAITKPTDIRYWLNCIGYGNGTFVLNGAGNDLWTSSDLANWTRKGNPGGYDDLTTIVYGNGTFVMRRFWANGAMIVSKDNGVNWTYVDTGGSPARWYNTLVFGNGKFLYPIDNRVRTSVDGLSWNETTVSGIPAGFEMSAVAQFDSSFFIGAHETSRTGNSVNVTTAYSSDGSNWTFNQSFLTSSSTGAFYSSGSFNGLLTLTSESSPAEVWVSSDRGVTWGKMDGPWNVAGNVHATFAANKDRIVVATDSGIYSVENSSIKITPLITSQPVASSISYGQSLASSTLSGGVASVAGTFAFTSSSTKPNAGTVSQGFIFTPTDTENYLTVSGSVSVTVSKATPTITTLPIVTSITYGQTLASSTLKGGQGSVAGSFAFTAPSTVPSAGTASQGFTFTPTDSSNYKSVTGVVSVTVNEGSAIYQVSNVYSGDGSQDVLFQNADGSLLSGGIVAIGYFPENYDIPGSVSQANIAAAVANFTPLSSALCGSYSISLDGSFPGYVEGEQVAGVNSSNLIGRPLYVFVGNASTLAASTSIAIRQMDVFRPNNPPFENYYGLYVLDFINGAHAPVIGKVSTFMGMAWPEAGYDSTYQTLQLSERQLATVITAPTASAITYGQTLASSTLSGGVASVPGNFAFTTPSTVPSAGTYSASFTFTPSDTASYTAATGTVDVIVNVPVSITAQPIGLTINQGASATFSVAATGTAPTYQWKKAGVNISGATGATLTLNNVQPADAGSYTVEIANAANRVTSQAASLAVISTASTVFSAVESLLPLTDAALVNLNPIQKLAVVTGAAAHSGGNALKFQTVNSGSTYAERTLVGPSLVSFSWRASSEEGFDFFRYSIDGVTRKSISGDGAWLDESLQLGAGTHTIRWTFSKDESDANFEDAAYLDDLVIVEAYTNLEVTAAGVAVTGSSTLDYGTILQNLPEITQELTFKNTGTLSMDVAAILPDGCGFVFDTGEASTAFSLGAGEEVLLGLVLQTAVPGQKTAVLEIEATDSKATAPAITLSGYVQAIQPNIGCNWSGGAIVNDQSAAIDFGATPNDIAIAISNAGSAALTIASVSIEPATDFEVIAQPAATVAINGSTSFTLRALALHRGNHQAIVTIASNGGNAPNFSFPVASQSFPNITCSNGGALTSGQSTAIDFGAAPNDIVFTVGNTGSAPLAIASVSVSPATDFELISQPDSTVGLNGSTSFTLRALDANRGNHSATVTIASDDPNTPNFSFPVASESTPNMVCSWSGGPLASGQVAAMGFGAAPNEITVTIGNTGSAALSIAAVSIAPSGNFQVIHQPSASVAINGSTSFTLRALDVSRGSHAATVTIASNDGNAPNFSFPVTSESYLAPTGTSYVGGSFINTGTSAGWSNAAVNLPSGSSGQALKTGSTPDNGSSTIGATFDGPGLLSWNWQVSAQANYDWLLCEVNGVEVAGISTKTAAWQPQVLQIPAGAQVRWIYRKDGSNLSGSDTGYLSDIRFSKFTAAQSSFQDWSAANGNLAPTQAIPAGGMQAMFAWLSGVNPATGPATGQFKPSVSGGFYKYRYTVAKAAAGIVQPQISTDLVTWNSRKMKQTLISEDETSAVMELSVPATGKVFSRMATELPTYAPAGFSLIPSGSFTMGDALDGSSDAPTHTVTVSAFYMAKNLVTWAEYQSVQTWAASNGYSDLAVGAGKASTHPVQTMTWWDGIKYCNARSEMEGLTPVYTVSGAVLKTGTIVPEVNWTANGYRLPTEAEWEKAARGGLSGKRFPWGNIISLSQANFYNVDGDSYQTGATGFNITYATGSSPFTSPVGSFVANSYGLNDMAGNVWQWCWDSYGSYDMSLTTDPHGSSSNSPKVLRGGCWDNGANSCRVGARNCYYTFGAVSNVGFRVTRSSVP